MESIMVLPTSPEQKRVVFAFLDALKIKYLPTKPTLEELEARLLPGQKAVWENLKVGLEWVENRKNGKANDDVLIPAGTFLANFDSDEG